MNQHADEIIRLYKEKGYLDEGFDFQTLPKRLMYAVSEIGEAFDAWRDNDLIGLGKEFADIAIVVIACAKMCGYDLDEEIRKKMEFNWTRENKHGRVNI